MKKLLSALFCLTLVLGITLGLASCGKVEFKVNFIVDGEVYSSLNTSGEETIKIPQNPTKEGYIFDGWYWDKDTWHKPFTANSLLDAPLSSDMSVYAKFTDENAVKGTEVELSGFEKMEDDSLGTVYYISVSNSKIVYSLSEVVTVNNKSKWTVSTDLSGNDTIASKTVELSVGYNIYYLMVEDEFSNVQQYILLIRRRPIHTVTYYQSVLNVHSTEKVEEGAFANPPTLTAPNGYHFGGWSYDFSNPIISNVDAGIIWAPNEYTLTYDANGGTVSIDTQDIKYGTNFTLASANRPGYSFGGWYDGSIKLTSGEWKYTRDITVKAKWIPNNYFITYYLNGGANSAYNPSNYDTGDSITLREPTKKGYTFLGWTYSGVTEPTKNVVIASGEYGNKAYTAKWQANEYTLTFNADGGNCETLEKIGVYDKYVTLPTADREGYEFLGWYNGTTEITSGYWKTDSDVDLIAKWELIPYRITYILNGGTNAALNPESYNIISESFYLVDPVREGYEFLGWTYEGQSTPVKLVTIENGSKGDRAFTANWQAKSFTVGFDANGGECSTVPLEVTYDDYCELPVPTRVGYTFAGWYFDGKKYESGICKIADDITLVAQWDIINYSISYTLNGGTNPTGNPTSYNVLTGANIKNPTRTGYTFLGWTYSDITTPTKDVKLSAGTIDSKVFTAHWQANEYTLSFNVNGGSVEKGSIPVTYDDNYSVPTPTRIGYIFKGWFDGKTQYSGGAWKVANDVIVVAKWEAKTYTINYNANGGSVSGTTQTVTFDKEFILREPSRTGYTFLGWYNGEDKVISGVWTVDSGMSLKAEWQANSYAVTYDANGGTASHTGDTATYDSDFTLATAERVGYTFVGWYDGTNLYTDGTWKTADAVKLVAKWTANTDTKYVVNHHLQNIYDDGYTLDMAENLKGTSDSNVTPSVKTYTGFTSPSAKTVKISPDGSLIVDYYYTRNSYTISFVTNGGSSVEAQTYKYQEKLNLPETDRGDVTFGGWFTTQMLVAQFSNTTMPASDKIVYAWWQEENKPTDFTYTGTDAITISSYVGTSATMWIPAYINGIPVTTIESAAFSGKTMLVKVVVPKNIVSIGSGAFAGCTSLEDLTLPFIGITRDADKYSCTFGEIFERGTYSSYYGLDTTWVYQGYSWSGSATHYVIYDIPKTIKKVTITDQQIIPQRAFYNCNFIEEIILPDTVTTFKDKALYNCNATITYFSTEE